MSLAVANESFHQDESTRKVTRATRSQSAWLCAYIGNARGWYLVRLHSRSRANSVGVRLGVGDGAGAREIEDPS